MGHQNKSKPSKIQAKRPLLGSSFGILLDSSFWHLLKLAVTWESFSKSAA